MAQLNNFHQNSTRKIPDHKIPDHKIPDQEMISRYTLACIAFIMAVFQLSAQDCPASSEERFNKIMSAAFADQYITCNVTTKVEFFAAGPPKGWILPSKVKKDVHFMAIQPGSPAGKHPLTGDAIGETICVKKEVADIVFDLKKGDMLKLTGITYVHNYFGQKTVYFLASKVEKL